MRPFVSAIISAIARSITVCATVSLPLLGGLDPAWAESATLKGQAGDRINIRSQPSTGATAPHYGLPGDRVEILQRRRMDDNYTWYYVRFAQSKVEGWVRGDLLTVDSSGSRSQRIAFATGSASAVAQGTVRGYDTQDYLLTARAGQTMNLRLTSDNSFAYFVVFKPDGSNLITTPSTTWVDKLPANGDYTVRVFLMRAEARRGGEAKFRLQVGIR